MSSFLTETPLKSNIINNPIGNQANDDPIPSEINISRKIEFDRGNPLTMNLCSNHVSTIPSSAKDIFLFIWRSIGNSPFHMAMLAILLFYLIVFICTPREISQLQLHNSVSFHVIIFIIELMISFAKYITIYLNDSKVNNQAAKIYSHDHKKFIESQWKNIKVGHIIRVNMDEVVPADMIILEAMDHNHQCYVDYSAINGIFDAFVMKKACNDTHSPSMKKIKFHEYVKNIKGVLRYEEPNATLHSFTGRLKLESFPRASEITEENFVMRGSTIKNIKWVYGLVVYTGMETKIMQTLKIAAETSKNKGSVTIMKRDRDIIRVTLKTIQYLVIWLYCILLLISLMIELYKNVICYYSFSSPIGDDHSYLMFYSIESAHLNTFLNIKSHPFYQLYYSVVQFALTFHLIFPFNWMGLIDIAYMILSKLIQWDIKVLLKPKNTVEIINDNCLADFGQVKYILTDKTGTLTSRKYQLKACSINGKLFSFDASLPKDENFVFQYRKNNYDQLEIMQDLKVPSPFSTRIKEFFECLCLCHSVKVSSNSKEAEERDILLGSCYAEERSMLKMIDKLGFRIKKTKNSRVLLDINGEEKTHYVIGANKYTEERRRMSVLVKLNSEDKESVLLCKANDFSIFSLCRKTNQSEIEKTKHQIKEMNKHGLRFFIFCKRVLNEDETITFLTRYKSAENYVIKSEEHLKSLAIEYEKDFEFLGVLFFEEKVSNDLKFCIHKLNYSGIKVWVASGDKKENVISVARNLNLYNSKAIKGEFSDKDKPEDLDIKMSMLLMQFLFPNEKISKMKTRTGANVNAQELKGSSKDLTIIISGGCFSRICADQRNFQSLATLLSYCTNLLGYQFNPNNKYLLCQMMRKYVSKNSKVLAVGDGFNDFTMLKEADLSIGIRSKEILQVRNFCDAIVTKFSQIPDIILVHGTLNYRRLINISLLSFYANFLIIFPMFLHQNANPIGSAFYNESPLKLTLDILIINLTIIFLCLFDTPIDRSIISQNSNVYKGNFYDLQMLIFDFGIEFIKSGADSLILYYLNFSTDNPINAQGENYDQNIFGNSLLYASYTLIIVKIFALRLNSITYLHILTVIIAIGGFIGATFIYNDQNLAIVQGFSYFTIVLLSLIAIIICAVYEYIAITIMNNFITKDFILQMTTVIERVVKENLLFKNHALLNSSLSREMPAFGNKIDKMSYPEVLGRIFKKNKVIDPALENMADVSNEEIAMIKIKKPFITFHDIKLEEDFMVYSSKNIMNSYLCYLLTMLLFWIVDTILEGFSNGQLISKILSIISILIGSLLFFGIFKRKFDKFFPLYLYLLLTIEIISIYIEKTDNDVKICLKMVLLFSFPLLFTSRKSNLIFPAIVVYVIAITPAIFLNDYGFSILTNQEFFLYSNLPLLYHRHIILYGTFILFITFSYYTDIEHRIEFLKYHKSQAELKKDNLIMANLIPDFVREKMQNGERGATRGYEVVTIVFCDISDFDSLVAKLSPKELLYFLDELYNVFDQYCLFHGLQKIETVGKTYMAAGGIKECEADVNPSTLSVHEAVRCFEFGVDILDLIEKMILTNGDKVKVKIGIHTGKVIPAVVGAHKPQFSLIGDTVNTTARMCAYSNDNCVNCSQFTYEEIKYKYKDFIVSSRDVKGKGMMNLYLYNPFKNKKTVDNLIRPTRGKESSGNIVMKSVTRNCPIVVRQGTKTSVRNPVNNNNNNNNNNPSPITPNKNEVSRYSNKHNSQIENSILIEENSFDGLNGNEYKTTTQALTKKQQKNLPEKKEEMIANEENKFLKDSFLFFSFKTEAIKNEFTRFEKHRFTSSINLSMFINVSFLLVFLICMYLLSQYAFLSNENISLFIALKAILLVILVGVIYQTKKVIVNYGPSLSWINFIIFFLFTIVNQVEVNILNEKFLINLAVEEVLIMTAINFNGMLTYFQSSINCLLNIIIFLINLGLNSSNHLILKYSIFLIVITVIAFVYRIILYYNLTLDFQRNQNQASTLEKTEKMLFNLMPVHVVQNMKDDIPVVDVLIDVTILFADIVRFTDFSACHEPGDVVNLVSELFKRFDDSTKTCNVYKVHTIGDCYVVLGFTGKVPFNDRNIWDEAKNVCKMGESMISTIREVRKKVNFEQLDMRIGIHTGAIIAGIIGTTVVRYDIFGSDVLIANKMESAGEPGHINISEMTKKVLETLECPFKLKKNKMVAIPSVGKEVECYFIDNDLEE